MLDIFGNADNNRQQNALSQTLMPVLSILSMLTRYIFRFTSIFMPCIICCN